MLTPVWRRSLLIYSHKISTISTLNMNNVYPLVVFSIRSKVDSWVSIGSSLWVLYIIRFGHRIPFTSLPPRTFFRINRSALDHSSFVDIAISDLLLSGSVIEVFTPPTVVNPLTVSANFFFFFVFEGWGVRRLVKDEFIPLFFCKKQYKRIINKSAAFSWKTIFWKIRFSRDLCF